MQKQGEATWSGSFINLTLLISEATNEDLRRANLLRAGQALAPAADLFDTELLPLTARAVTLNSEGQSMRKYALCSGCCADWITKACAGEVDRRVRSDKTSLF